MITPMRNPDYVYKIATVDSIAEAETQGAFTGMPVDLSDGFIHFSTAAQLPETIKLHFAGQDELMLLALRPSDFGSSLRWEPSRGGALFPHLYGTFPMTSVAWSAPLAVADDGSCDLPEQVQ
jgi:uncharacterized protein (DUF952 family)